MTSVDKLDLGIAVVLVLGGTYWSDKNPTQRDEAQVELSEVACSVSF